MRGRVFMVRFAAGAALGFERESDARRVLEVLTNRLGRFGLTLHSEKRAWWTSADPTGGQRGRSGNAASTCSASPTFKAFPEGALGGKKAKSRFTRASRRFNEWCRRNRHLPAAEQRAARNCKLRGHDA